MLVAGCQSLPLIVSNLFLVKKKRLNKHTPCGLKCSITNPWASWGWCLWPGPHQVCCLEVSGCKERNLDPAVCWPWMNRLLLYIQCSNAFWHLVQISLLYLSNIKSMSFIISAATMDGRGYFSSWSFIPCYILSNWLAHVWNTHETIKQCSPWKGDSCRKSLSGLSKFKDIWATKKTLLLSIILVVE